MTRQDIIESLMRIALTIPYIDTAMVRSARPEWESNSLGATYEDFLQGHFISTDWYLAGADPESISADFPALFIEQVNVTKPSVYGQEICYNFDLLLLDRYCRDCTRKTRESVLDHTLDALRLVVAELLTYERTPDGMRSAGEIEYNNGIPTSDNLDSYFNTRELNFQQVTLNANTMGYRTRLQFCFCNKPDEVFMYNVPRPELLATDEPCDDC